MDDREFVEVDLPDDVLLTLALQAHERDITLNQHINNILRTMLKEEHEDRKSITPAK